jgi:hypothetical protein
MTGPIRNAVHNPSGVSSMGRLSNVIAGAMLMLGVVGCGESELDSGTMPFKTTDTAQFESLKEQMKASLTKKTYQRKPTASKTKEKAEPKVEEKTGG